METPAILLLVFRRADLVLRMIDALRPVRPSRIFVSADGPRPGAPGEAEACLRAREALGTIDWPCRVVTRFHETNQGVRLGVSGGIDWFFTQVDEGVILEEDCLPHPDFFGFCGRMLDRYRDDERVMQVSGTNFQPRHRSGAAAYFFSRYNHCWGWATWKRAWVLFHREMDGLDDFLAEADRSRFWENRRERKYWRLIFRRTASGRVQSWAYRWTYTLWAEGGLCIYPEANLVSNLGFGAGATNTADRDRAKAARPWGALGTPVPPPAVIRNRPADLWTFRHLYWGTPWARFVHRVRKVRSLLGPRRIALFVSGIIQYSVK